jgi:RNA polymerase sigma-70 factor (ECF subfamily)
MLEMALPADRVTGPNSEADQPPRLARIFVNNYRLVWRLVRRLGIPLDSADDASQEVFLVAAERLHDIREKSERAFVFGIALRARC